jgi:hypothetical protein
MEKTLRFPWDFQSYLLNRGSYSFLRFGLVQGEEPNEIILYTRDYDKQEVDKCPSFYKYDFESYESCGYLEKNVTIEWKRAYVLKTEELDNFFEKKEYGLHEVIPNFPIPSRGNVLFHIDFKNTYVSIFRYKDENRMNECRKLNVNNIRKIEDSKYISFDARNCLSCPISFQKESIGFFLTGGTTDNAEKYRNYATSFFYLPRLSMTNDPLAVIDMQQSSKARNPAQIRKNGAAIQLPNGNILITGGEISDEYVSGIDGVSNACEEFINNEGKWIPRSPMLNKRSHHCLVLLDQYTIMAIGGRLVGTVLNTCEYYIIERDLWVTAPNIPKYLQAISALCI